MESFTCSFPVDAGGTVLLPGRHITYVEHEGLCLLVGVQGRREPFEIDVRSQSQKDQAIADLTRIMSHV